MAVIKGKYAEKVAQVTVLMFALLLGVVLGGIVGLGIGSLATVNPLAYILLIPIYLASLKLIWEMLRELQRVINQKTRR